ncbi:unnamed protein product [Closterium sp. Naga37s-1]|nr:unnamed protein product [Closterium sp. Naga37s-1]
MGAHVSRHVDERLDDLEVYQRAVAATFSERSKPPSDGVDAAPGIQQAQLLDACKAVLQRISAELDPRAGRVCLRVPTPRDLDFALSRHPALAQLPMLSFAEFERVTRCVLKRVAADRGRRLLLFVTGGVIAVQMAKGTIPEATAALSEKREGRGKGGKRGKGGGGVGEESDQSKVDNGPFLPHSSPPH